MPAGPPGGGAAAGAAAHNPLTTPISTSTPTGAEKRRRIGRTDYVVDATGEVRGLDPVKAAAAFMTASRNAQLDGFNAPALSFSAGGLSTVPVNPGEKTRVAKRAFQCQQSAKERRARDRRLFEASRAALPGPSGTPVTKPVVTPEGMPTLREQGQAVARLASNFNADRTGSYAYPGHPEAGSLTPSTVSWFRLAPFNEHAPGEPSAWAKPTVGGTKQKTTYNTAEGVFSTSEFDVPTPAGALRRALVSAGESGRSPGAGYAQLLAEKARDTADVRTRDEMYGHGAGATSVPGLVPASYSGSATDIQMAERHSAEPDSAERAVVLAQNPLVQQVGETLALSRSMDVDAPRQLRRSHSVGLPGRSQDYDADAEKRLDSLGLRPLQQAREL